MVGDGMADETYIQPGPARQAGLCKKIKRNQAEGYSAYL